MTAIVGMTIRTRIINTMGVQIRRKGGDFVLKSGDTIKCSDAEEMIKTMNELEKENIHTDFLYEKDGEKGYWLEIL